MGRVGVQAAALCATLVVARIVAPKYYGIVGIARVVTAFLEIFRDLGTSSAIIQRKTIGEDLLASVFWLNLALGGLLMGLVCATAPLLAEFYREPLLSPVLRALSGCFVIVSLGGVPAALLNREMRFRAVSMIELTAAVGGMVAAVAAALAGLGIWSLVIGAVVNVTVPTILFLNAAGWMPRKRFVWGEIRPLLRYSLNLSGFQMVNYASRNADNLIVGKFLGAAALGYYQVAYNLLLYSIQGITMVAGRVLFPALTQVQGDSARLRAGYTRGVSMMAAVVFPAMVGVVAVADPFVRAILGTQWLAAIPVIVILAPVGVIQCVTMPAAHLYSATGRTDRMFRWEMVSTAIYVGSFFAGLPWGIRGVAAGYLIANAALFIPSLLLAFRSIDLKLSEFLRPLWPVLAISGAMFAVVWLAARAVAAWAPVWQLTLLIPMGAVVYLGLMAWIRPEPARNLMEAVRQSQKSAG
jgi:PST family polysaccharide transporter